MSTWEFTLMNSNIEQSVKDWNELEDSSLAMYLLSHDDVLHKLSPELAT